MAVPVLGDGVGAVPVVGGIGTVCVPGGTVLVPGEVAVPVELPEPDLPDLPALSPGRLGARNQCVIFPLVMMKFTRAVVPVPWCNRGSRRPARSGRSV